MSTEKENVTSTKTLTLDKFIELGKGGEKIAQVRSQGPLSLITKVMIVSGLLIGALTIGMIGVAQSGKAEVDSFVVKTIPVDKVSDGANVDGKFALKQDTATLGGKNLILKANSKHGDEVEVKSTSSVHYVDSGFPHVKSKSSKFSVKNDIIEITEEKDDMKVDDKGDYSPMETAEDSISGFRVPQRGAIISSDGVKIAENGKDFRCYSLGKVMGNVTGYVREVWHKDALEGITGIEKRFDDALSKGDDVILTIDSKIQKVAYELLKRRGVPGAIVVQDPNNGKILALVSYPNVDMNIFSFWRKTSDFELIRKNKSKPMLDRSLSPFNAGAVMTPLIELSTGSGVLRNPTIEYQKIIEIEDTRIADWARDRDDENHDVISSLENMCNTCFIQLALKAKMSAVLNMAKEMGFDESVCPTGVSLGECGGCSKPSDRKIDTVMFGMGYGLLVSPLQVNRYMSALATGELMYPELVEGVKLKAGKKLIGIGKVNEESLNVIRERLKLAVSDGTGSNVKVDGVNVAGLTGTTLSNPRINTMTAWFSGYAPFEQPKLAITILLDGEKDQIITGGKDAAPIATELFKLLLSN